MKGSHVAHKSREWLWIPPKEVDEAAFGQSLVLFLHTTQVTGMALLAEKRHITRGQLALYCG